ncbi:MAG: hypothetical protein ACJASM_000850 [Salibacteraceae bacterium]|jgi:hypothetical protein
MNLKSNQMYFLIAFFMFLLISVFAVAQDTTVLSVNKNIRLIDGAKYMHADLILGNEHQFEGKVSFNEDSTIMRCESCKYFFQTGNIGIDLAEVDVEMNPSSNDAKIYFRKSYTETFIIPTKLKIQIIEMDFDIRSDQPALMNPLVTDEFLIFERSQLVYYNGYQDSTTWLANRVKIDLKKGDVYIEGIEVFKPYDCEIKTVDNSLKINKKGNFYPLKNAILRFTRYGDIHEIQATKVSFKKQSTFFSAKGFIEEKDEKYPIKKIHPERVGGIYQITGKVKGVN